MLTELESMFLLDYLVLKDVCSLRLKIKNAQHRKYKKTMKVDESSISNKIVDVSSI